MGGIFFIIEDRMTGWFVARDFVSSQFYRACEETPDYLCAARFESVDSALDFLQVFRIHRAYYRIHRVIVRLEPLEN